MRSLLSLIPNRGQSVLDVGARDGRLASLLTERFERTVALDLVRPRVSNLLVECVAGDATSLPFEDTEFDTVVCTEVLEHIPRPGLERACSEIVRVARRAIDRTQHVVAAPRANWLHVRFEKPATPG